MAYPQGGGIDEFIMEELQKRMMEQEGEPMPMQGPQRTPNVDMDPMEPSEGHIESLRRRFGPDDLNEDDLESLIRRNMPGRRY